MRATRVLAAVAVALLAASVSACTGDDDVADGFRRVAAGWMTVDVPEGWVDAEPSGMWTQAFSDAAGDEATAQLAIAPEYGETDALGAVSDVIGSLQLGAFPDFTVVEPPVPATGEPDYAHRATRWFTYTGDDGATLEGVLWGVADDERAVLVQLTGRDLDLDVINEIGESIQVVGPQADG
jgi:hypothetical protein